METLIGIVGAVVITIGFFALRLWLRMRYGVTLEQALAWIDQAELMRVEGNGRFENARVKPLVYLKSETGEAYYFVSRAGKEVRESIELFNVGALGRLAVFYLNGRPTNYHGPMAMLDGMQENSAAMANELLQKIRAFSQRAIKLHRGKKDKH